MYSLCKDELAKLKSQGAEVYAQIDEWKKIDVNEQFIEELKAI